MHSLIHERRLNIVYFSFKFPPIYKQKKYTQKSGYQPVEESITSFFIAA